MRRSLVTLLVVAVGGLPGQGPYPPPGRLVDIGGRRLHLNCSGRGTPVVILVAGGGAFSIDWALVQPHVAGTTRVCSYDRAGLGWSDPGPAEETVQETVADLHRLLQAARARALPAGRASLAGLYIRATVTVTLRYMRHAPEAYLDQDAKAMAAHMKRDQEAQVPASAARSSIRTA